MLPGELLVTKTKKDRIYPDFVQIDEEHLELAEDIIGVYRNFVGKKKSELDEIFEEFEEGLNFKLVRGLRTLLERRCVFESRFVIEPILARRAVFEEASNKRITNERERGRVIENAAKRLNISIPDLEDSLWADQDSEVVLEKFEPLNPEELLKLYNLSLAQTLLFKSIGMTVSFKGNYKEVFRTIKYLGLMYMPEGEKVRIEGASSLLKMNEKYGTSLAKLLPIIVNCDEWCMDAEIVIRRMNAPRIYHFIMDSGSRGLLMSKEREDKILFDSGVEERFYNKFLSSPASKGWDLIREPEAIFTSKGVFIPDFKFKHKELNIETYFEIVGFWTEDYIKRKLSKLRAFPFDILVAADKNLACFNLNPNFDLGLNHVILFNRDVPIGEVVRYLRGVEEKEIERQIKGLKGREIELEGDIISIGDIAKRYDVSREAIRECLNNPDYVVFKEVVVRKEILSKLKESLLKLNYYGEARKTIEEAGLSNPDEVLNKLGFKIIWKGLDPSAATIELS